MLPEPITSHSIADINTTAGARRGASAAAPLEQGNWRDTLALESIKSLSGFRWSEIFTDTVVKLLKSERPSEDLQSELFDLLGFDQTQNVLKFRSDIVAWSARRADHFMSDSVGDIAEPAEPRHDTLAQPPSILRRRSLQALPKWKNPATLRLENEREKKK